MPMTDGRDDESRRLNEAVLSELKEQEREGERGLAEAEAVVDALRTAEATLAKVGNWAGVRATRERREKLEAGSKAAVAKALGLVREQIEEASLPPFEQRILRLHAEDVRYAIDALTLCRSLATGSERARYDKALVSFEEAWQHLRARYQALAGEDLERLLNGPEAKKARLGMFGPARTVEERGRLVDRLRGVLEAGTAHRHALVMHRAGLKLPGTQEAILAHYRASITLGKLAPDVYSHAIGGAR